MDIVKQIVVPTGSIFTAVGELNRQLEFLYVGDYGKNANIKADFLGITRELNGVPNGKIEPLENKMVVTISTQYGCSMNCKFCDVPKVGAGLNVTKKDLHDQICHAISNSNVVKTERLNIHYARMGEPTFNKNVIHHARELSPKVRGRGKLFGLIDCSVIHPVISTMCPRSNKHLAHFIINWIDVKNNYYKGDAGLQLSINSTDEEQRKFMFSGNAMELEDISKMMLSMPNPKGRKYTLNFALADEYIIDEFKLARLFPVDRFICKITPLHKTNNSISNDIKTSLGYEEFTPYKDVESRLKAVGYDVIVFVPSHDEDESLITCGNAVLSGKMPGTKYKLINY